MNPEENYIEINLKSWNNRTDAHLESEFYPYVLSRFADNEKILINLNS